MLKLGANKKTLDQNHVLVVTTNSHERDAVLNVLHRHLKLTTGSHGRRAYLGYVGKTLVVVLDGAGGYADADAATRFAVAYLKDPSNPKPALVLMAGICWGNPKHVLVGDVIVCNVVHSANRSTARPDQREIKTYAFTSSARVDELVAGSNVKVRQGGLISLEVRLMDEATRDELLLQMPTALGGEMEAFALVPECRELPWLVVKAVSDFGGLEETRETQPDAARKAADVVTHLIAQFEATRLVDLGADQAQLQNRLIEALHGQLLVIDISHLSSAQINSSIQAYFSQIETSVALHTNALATQGNLSRDVARLLLEIASNAFRHGRARKVEMRFDVRGIAYQDDGTAFEAATLAAIENGRGGQATYVSFVDRHANTGSVSLRPADYKDGNRLRIDISSDVPNLPAIVAKCSAAVDHAAMRRCERALRWASDCEVIYIDFESIAMMSTILDLCEELLQPISMGRRFVVLCSDADTVTEVTRRYPGPISNGQIRFIPAP